jgi:hypothetical protein
MARAIGGKRMPGDNGFIDPEQVETMVESCMEAMEEDDDLFSSWEVSFLENLEQYIVDHPVTDKQYDKLLECFGKVEY